LTRVLYGASGHRWLAAALVLGVLAAQLPATPGVGAPPPVAGATAAPPLSDEAAAAEAARQTGQPVEVASARTEATRLYVNPDGSRTLEQSALPRWTKHDDGTWVELDQTLHQADGGIAPVASELGLAFSAGGDGPLAVIENQGYELSLALPWALPAPVLDGPHATYREVLPGVDLVLTARPEGFAEVIVIKDRAAAARPELAALRFAVATSGVTLQPEGRGFVAVDQSGETVFTSPAPMMWDSAGGIERGLDWPAEGDRVAEVATTVGADEVVLTPDQSWLADSTLVYPVYVDPSVSGARNEWAMISSGFPSQEYYRFGGDEGLGRCQLSMQSSCEENQTKRLAWEFGISSAVHGSHVLEATFSAFETHAWSCTAKPVELWLVGGISGSTNWSNHAGTWSRRLHSVNVARRSGCANEPGRVEFNATSGAADFAANGWSSLTLGLRAANESTMTEGWKRFRNDATLAITYNSRPRTPAGLGVGNAGCVTGAGRPVVGTVTPTLRATVDDPDTETDLRLGLAWERWNGSWVAHGSGAVNNLRNDQQVTFTVGSGLVHGGIYRYRAQAHDPWSHEGSSGIDSSDWSGYCEFEVDTQAPSAEPAVTSPVYGTDLNQFYGSVGLTADFSFGAAGVGDVAGYRWGWADPPTTLVAAPSLGGGVTVPLTPPPPQATDPTSGGLLTLYVRSVDRASNPGPVKRYAFNIGSAAAPVGWWPLDEPAGATTVVDASGNGRNATASNLTLGAPGRLVGGSTVASFNGTSSSASTAGPVLDTSKSFTVSAWVRLTDKSDYRTVVSQDGTARSAFYFQYWHSGDRWALVTPAGDNVSPTTFGVATSTATPVLNQWTHLTGVYDAGAHQLRLYVNGELQGTASGVTVWRGNGPLRIGQAITGNHVPGQISDVRVWNRVLSAGEVAPMAATLVGRWRLDGDGTDATTFGRDATPSGVTWIPDRAGNPSGAARFSGTNSSTLATAGPVLRTDQGITVAAWVRLASIPATARTAVAQDGTNVSGFFLGYRPNMTWSFMMRHTDSTTATGWAVGSGGTAVVGQWVHLVGVYDPVAGQARLYVNGVMAGRIPAEPVWNAGGRLTIGFARWNGGSDWFPGDVDDVRVYQGVLPASEIAKLFQP
jgi:concanavalin A-like lectin/glucanase superfamily protein